MRAPPLLASALALAAVAGFGSWSALGGPEEGLARMVAHDVTIRLEPATGRIVVRDAVTFDTSKGRGFAVRADAAAKANVDLDGDGGLLRGRVSEGADRVVFEISRLLRTPVEKKDDLSWVAGDETSGIVFEKGAYLSGASGWYVRPVEPAPMRFDVTSYVPEPFLVVTQGGVPERKSVTFPAGWSSDTEVVPPEGVTGPPGTRYAVAVHRGVIATEDCSLSAGPYQVASRVVGGVTLSTYFYEQDHADAPLWLDAGEEVVRRYEKLLPPYPHPKFDVVANFFASGYGMPSYTLLGDEVIRYVTAGAKRSGGKIPPGYLDHEYVHGWYGNGLLVDPADGNWCEALTTYFSNYYAKELESPEAGLEHRRGVLEKYAIRVQPDEDYPVREFRTKTEDKDNDVGYGKGSMIFHMLRRRLGDERFFAAVRDLTAKRVGTFVSWKDWLAALDGEWARPWLERKGLPEVRLSAASALYGGDTNGTWNVRFEVRQVVPRGQEPYPFGALDYVSAWDQWQEPLQLTTSASIARFGAVEPGVVEVDPGYHVLRRVADEDLPYGLNRTLEERGGRVRWKGGDSVFAPLAKRLAEAAKAEMLPAGAESPQDGKPLISLVIASPDEVLAWPKDAADPVVLASPEKIVVKGKTYAGPQFALLFSHAVENGSRTTFYALSEKAAARAGYMTYYGWEQYVVFENGRPVDRGFLDRTPTATRRSVVRGDESAVRIDALIELLSSEEVAAGRMFAQPTATRDRVRESLSKELESFGDARGSTSFRVPRPRLSERGTLSITRGSLTRTLDYRPLFSSPALDTEDDSAAFVDLPSTAPLDRIREILTDVARPKTGSGAIVVMPAPRPSQVPSGEVDVLELVAPLFDLPDALTPSSEAAWKRSSGRSPATQRPAEPWISGRRQRLFDQLGPALAETLRSPGRPVLLAIRGDDATPEPEEAEGRVRVSFHWIPQVGDGHNLWASWAPPGATSAVLVGAHYDSWGLPFRGADDNASGVGCVLDAVRGLQPELAALTGGKRAIVVCLFDAEEWGLLGSRAYVANPPEGLPKIDVVVNVDSVGRVRDDSVYVLGLSKHPDLAKKAVDALGTQGLKVGRDIDAFGYDHGSDHWPFHRAGVPAITLWASDYATMDSVEDTPDKVDPVGVARVSKALRELLLRLLKE